MGFDYFYGQQSEMFSFYRIPKVLFTDERFWNISTDAKLLYGILLDRMNLERRYREEENTEIHDMVHAANLTPAQLAELLHMAGNAVPKPETINSVNEEENQNEN